MVLVAGSVALTLYLGTQRTVRLDIAGVLIAHRTHQTSTTAVLNELGIALHPADTVEVPLPPALHQGNPIVLRIARPVYILHDGSLDVLRTHAQDVGHALAEAGIAIGPHDRLLLDRAACSASTRLPTPEITPRMPAQALVAALREPAHLSVQRAVMFRVLEGAKEQSFYTTAATLGEALADVDMPVYAGDQVAPALATEISPGLTAHIDRARPLLVEVGGTLRMVRARAPTVRGILEELKLPLGDADYVLPNLDATVAHDARITLVRVHEEKYLEEIPIAYETRWEPDAAMEIDNRQIQIWGREGARRRRIQVRYENERELYRFEEDSWIAQEPVDRVIRYGTKILLRTIDTPSGPLPYWRHLRMLATSYSPSTAGVSASASYFGLTRLGIPATKGMVAVDPHVVNLRQEVFVPGYGRATANDTGSAIKGRRIDLCFDDHNLESWHRWVDVYLLAPAPASDDINWILPNTPVEKD